ncbi:MAG: DNRLRE domain-containing protein [Saonia sp.]
MKNFPIKFFNLVFLIIILFLQFSCEKDSDLLAEAVLNNPDAPIDEREGEDPDADPDAEYDVKTFSFSPINDAFLQGSKGFDQSIVRLEENNRTGYLMFDLSEINGEITEVTLEFTVYGDQGNGTINILKGQSNEWTEENLSDNNSPTAGVQLESINKTYAVASTEKVVLESKDIKAERTTIIMVHDNGNDLAIASKEHPSEKGPKLVVTYNAPLGSEDIPEQSPEEEGGNEEEEEEQEGNNEISGDVTYWKELFDVAWASEYSDAVEKSESGNAFQEYYFLAYTIDGLIQVWQATGDNKYLDDALGLIENTIDDAVPMGGANSGYLGWPSDLNKYGAIRNNEGTNLWESFLYRYVTTLLRIMNQSPNLRASGSYQARYDDILAFTKTHIWDKWYNRNSNLNDLYRSRTHMTSHWARIAMELYIIEGNQKYREVFDNISFAGMPNYGGASLRSRIYTNPSNPQAYSWYQTWDSNVIQDVNHGDDIVSFWVAAYENGMYWDLNDMKALVATTNDVVWTSNSPLKFAENIDGSGGSDIKEVISHGMLTVGRFDENLQNRIRNHYTLSSVRSREWQAMGIAALNRKILDDGRPVYPE